MLADLEQQGTAPPGYKVERPPNTSEPHLLQSEVCLGCADDIDQFA